MGSSEFHLMPQPGVTLSGATYGSGNYGTQTYGQQATDPVSAQRFIAVPLGGVPNEGIIYHEGDTDPPFVVKIFGDDATPLDMDPARINGVELRLWPVANPDSVIFLPATSVSNVESTATWVFAPDHLTPPGAYTPVVVAAYKSGRSLSAPFDQGLTFNIKPRS